MLTSQQEQFEYIANMLLVGVAQRDIAEATGLSEGRITQIKDTEEFQTIYQQTALAKLAEMENQNTLWNNIEAQATKVVVENLKWNKNPDFALRAAMVANKAQRRGKHVNTPIPATQAGSRVHLQLNTTYVQKIQQINVTRQEAPRAEHAEHGSEPVSQQIAQGQVVKEIDVLPPKQVEALLQKRAEENLVEDILGEDFDRVVNG